MSDQSRAAKAQATRERKKQEFRQSLLAEIERGPTRSVWQLGYDLACSTDAINKALDEDDSFIGLLNANRVAIPAHALRDPKWMRHVLDRAALPTVRADEKISGDSLPVPVVGDPTREADYRGLEAIDIDTARRLQPKKARQYIDDKAITYSKMIHEDAARTREAEVLRLDNQQKAGQIARLESEATKSRRTISQQQQRIERLEQIIGPEDARPTANHEEFRPHA